MSLVTRGLGPYQLAPTVGLGPESLAIPRENVLLPFGFVLTSEGLFVGNEDVSLSLGFSLAEANSAIRTEAPALDFGFDLQQADVLRWNESPLLNSGFVLTEDSVFTPGLVELLVEFGFGLVVADSQIAADELVNNLGFALSAIDSGIVTESPELDWGFQLSSDTITVRVESPLLDLGFSLAEFNTLFANELPFLDGGFKTSILVDIPRLARTYRSFPKGPSRQADALGEIGPVRIPNQKPVSVRQLRKLQQAMSVVHLRRRTGKVKGLPDKIPNQKPRC